MKLQKLLCGLLLIVMMECAPVPVAAAQRRYIVCLVAAETVQCTPPLTKDTALAVYNVFLEAPIGNLDAVYLEDTKSKRKTAEHQTEHRTRPEGEITL